MAKSWFRSSPSFVVGILLVVLIAGVYFWRWSRPHSRGASDVIVREFVTTAQKEVYECRRASQRALDKLRSGTSPAEVIQAINAATDEAGAKIEGHAEVALNQLEQLDDLPLRTERNRRTRIRSRLREFKDAIAEVRDDAVEDLESYRDEHKKQIPDKDAERRRPGGDTAQ